MGKYRQIFLEDNRSLAMTPPDKKNTELIPTRDEVEQSRQLVEEIRRTRTTDSQSVRDKDR